MLGAGCARGGDRLPGAGAGHWLRAWWRQGAGAGCWVPVWALAARVVETGCWAVSCWVPVLVLGAGC